MTATFWAREASSFLADESPGSDVWCCSLLWCTELSSHKHANFLGSQGSWGIRFHASTQTWLLDSIAILCCPSRSPGNLSNTQRKSRRNYSGIMCHSSTNCSPFSTFLQKTVFLEKILCVSGGSLKRVLCKQGEKWWLCRSICWQD